MQVGPSGIIESSLCPIFPITLDGRKQEIVAKLATDRMRRNVTQAGLICHSPPRERLLKLLRSLPSGSKAPLARVCGVKSRARLMALTRASWWFPVQMQRITRILDAIESGELIPMDTGKRYGHYPQIIWRWCEVRDGTGNTTTRRS